MSIWKYQISPKQRAVKVFVATDSYIMNICLAAFPENPFEVNLLKRIWITAECVKFSFHITN